MASSIDNFHVRESVLDGQALASAEKTFKPVHPTIAIGRSNLALMLKNLGQLVETCDLLRHAYRAYLNRIGADHPVTRTIKGHLDRLGQEESA